MNYFMNAMKAHNANVDKLRTFFLILYASCVNPDTIAEAARKHGAELISVNSMAYDELTSVEKSELFSADIECIVKIKAFDMGRANAIRSAIRFEFDPSAFDTPSFSEDDEEISEEYIAQIRADEETLFL